MAQIVEIVNKLQSRTLLCLGFGIYFLIIALQEFLPNFNGPIGMLIIATALLVVGCRNARRDLAKVTS